MSDGTGLHFEKPDVIVKHVGVDLSTKYAAIAGVGDSDIGFARGLDLKPFKDPIERAWQIFNYVQLIVYGCRQAETVHVETPFFTRNAKTGRVLQELSTAAALGVFDNKAKLTQSIVVAYVDNNTWKSRLGFKAKHSKEQTKAWAHDSYEFPEIPDWSHTFIRGKKAGITELTPNDCYDAIAIATFGREVACGSQG